MRSLISIVASTERQIEDAQRVRFQVYCEEEGLLPALAAASGREIDARDLEDGAVHFIVYSGDEPAGTVRLLLPEAASGGGSGCLGLPLESKLDLDVFRAPGIVPAEVTRYCVPRRHRSTGAALALFSAMYEESARLGITHWVAGANMETDCAEDAAIAHRVLAEQGRMHERIRVEPWCREAPRTPRRRPFYTEEQRLRAMAGDLAGLPLPRPPSIFAARMGARFIGAPVYDAYFEVFALPLCASLADIAAQRAGALVSTACPSASSRAG